MTNNMMFMLISLVRLIVFLYLRFGPGGTRTGELRDCDLNLEMLTASHTRWSGGMGYLWRGKWIRDEKFVSGRGEPSVGV